MILPSKVRENPRTTKPTRNKAPNTPMAKPTATRTAAMLIAGTGLDAERDFVRFAARIAALSVATDPLPLDPWEPLPLDPLPLEPLEPLPDLLRAGSTGAVPRTDGAVVAERTEEAILRVGTLASSHQPGPSWPCD